MVLNGFVRVIWREVNASMLSWHAFKVINRHILIYDFLKVTQRL